MTDIVERLRLDVDETDEERGCGFKELADMEREAAADDIEWSFLANHDEIDSLTLACKEIARLRDQVVRLSTLVDIERGLRDAEIERLRGLLQWWIDAGPDADWDDYEQRILKEIRNAR